MHREVRDLVTAARRQGWTVDTSKQHPRFYAPGGNKMIVGAGTPSDHRTTKNLLADLRRNGLEDNPERRSPRSGASAPGPFPMDVIERRADRQLLAAGILELLDEEPLSEGLLAYRLRARGVSAIRKEVFQELKWLSSRGWVRQCGSEWALTTRERRGYACSTNVNELEPTQAAKQAINERLNARSPRRRKKAPLVCVLRKGVWHVTSHNKKPVSSGETLCGYRISGEQATFEERQPTCPHCKADLKNTIFL